MGDPLELSIVICTYNRAELVAEALESLLPQGWEDVPCEVVVVDNNSTDNTRAAVARFQGRLPALRYVLEPQRGLSHARNRGWKEARGRYVGYLDDDARASRNWIRTAARIARGRGPDAFGGPYYAFYKSPTPYWWKDSYRSVEHASTARNLLAGEYVSGGNMFVRRDRLEALGGFDAAFGMARGRLAYGEETVLIQRLRERFAGATVYYDPELSIQHLVRKERMKLRVLARDRLARGRDTFKARKDPAPNRPSRLRVWARIGRAMGGVVTDVLRGTFRRDRSRYPFLPNYLYEHTGEKLMRLGALLELDRKLRSHGHSERGSP
ncbi:MAG TPA: glycosyltransferase family 2 protein [Longimicrobiales bacterium]|nr:glycosyltransferase family 2 protein [Longimicrobiales bacterium]